jgi:hypothetical protein
LKEIIKERSIFVSRGKKKMEYNIFNLPAFCWGDIYEYWRVYARLMNPALDEPLFVEKVYVPYEKEFLYLGL